MADALARKPVNDLASFDIDIDIDKRKSTNEWLVFLRKYWNCMKNTE